MEFDVNKSNMVKCIAIIAMLWHHLIGCFPDLCAQYGLYSLFIPWDSIVLLGVQGKICVGIYVFLTAFGIDRTYNVPPPWTGRRLRIFASAVI